jgi:hypothetical protein
MNLDYYELYKTESAGTYGAFGLQINVACHLPQGHRGEPELKADLQDEAIQRMLYDVSEQIKKTVMRVQIARIPAAKERAKRERDELTGLFQTPIFVEDIPNGYCSDYCCAHLPWFIVTTAVGKIKIGWRKRVISIGWKDTKDTKTSSELFPSENVTKDEKLIHAWDLTRAKAYVDAIVSGVALTPLVQNAIPA